MTNAHDARSVSFFFMLDTLDDATVAADTGVALCAMADDGFNWQKYERHIYEKLVEWAGPHATVEFNQSVVGKFSGVPRQVDAVISGRFANATDRDITAAVDCKYYARDIDVKKVDEFIGFVDDVQTDLGLLITNKGFSPGALRRANRGIELLVIVANVDRLPPIHHPAWDEPYYEGDFHEVGHGGSIEAAVRHSYIDDSESEYPLDPDDMPERNDQVVLVEGVDTLDWGTEAGRFKTVRAVLEHRGGGAAPSDEDVKTVVEELAFHWEDGQPWVLYDRQIDDWL